MNCLLYLCLQGSLVTTVLAGCSGTTTLLTVSSKPEDVISIGYSQAGNNPCIWKVSRGHHDVMQVSVVNFDTEVKDTCANTLEIIAVKQDGIRTSLGVWCERTYGNVAEVDADIIIKFRPGIGSKPKLDLQMKGIERNHLCRNNTQLTATSTPMYLYSPLYPVIPIDWQLHCRWVITSSNTGHVILLEAVHFQLNYKLIELETNNLTVKSGTVNRVMIELGPFFILGDSNQMELELAYQRVSHWIDNPVSGMVLRYSALDPGNSTTAPPVVHYCSNDDNELAPQIFRSSGRVMILTSRVGEILSDSEGFKFKYYSRHKFDLDMGSFAAKEKEAFVFLNVQHNKRVHSVQGFKASTEGYKGRCVKLEIVSPTLQSLPDLHFAQIIRVFDGGNSSADELGTCTAIRSSIITSSSTYMYVEIRTGAVTSVSGVWMKFTAVEECSVNDIFSPHSPNVLPQIPPTLPDIRPISCRWRIRAGSGRIILDTKKLELGYHSNNDHCQNGYIRAYDGFGGNRRDLAIWCTASQSTVVSRKSMDMTVVYRSSNVGADKYTVQYREVNDEDLQGFGGHLPHATVAESYFLSPNYPGFYPNELTTNWRLTVSYGYEKIELVVMIMDTEGSYGNCEGFDVLKIYDGTVGNETNLKDSLCGTGIAGHTVLSSGKDVFMEFKSNAAVVKRGFGIAYTAIKKQVTIVCGSELTVDEIMETVKIPASQLQSNKSCVITLLATPFHSIIILDVLFLANNSSMNCSQDYLRVRNGAGLQSPLLGQWGCDSRVKVESSGPDLHLEIYPNLMVGMQLRYYSLLADQNCVPGWVEDLRSDVEVQTFSAPQLPVKHANMRDCKWRIRSVLESSFISVNLTSDNNKHDIQVNIYDGFDDENPLLSSWSAGSPVTLHSSGQFLFMSASLANFKSGFTCNFVSLVKPVTTTPIPESSPAACHSINTTDKPEKEKTTSTKQDYPIPPTEKPCSCPSPLPCVEKELECATPAGNVHGQTALIIGGCLAGFSVLAISLISSLLVFRYKRVRQHYTMSQKTASHQTGPPAARSIKAFDEPFRPEIFDPNDPRLTDDGDLGLASSQDHFVRDARNDTHPRYEMSVQKDLVFDTAL